MNTSKRKLSKSACSTYMQCPASYDYSYNQNIRPIRTGSPLVFGGAIDAALNRILLGGSRDQAMADYRAAFKNYEIGKMLPMFNDYDAELLSDETKKELLEGIRVYGYDGDDLDGTIRVLLGRVHDQIELSDNQYKAVDFVCRRSLAEKAALMLEAYELKVLPQIKKTYNVQKRSGPGFLDATVEWDGIGKVVLDHKTSGKPYADNQCDYSLELALYADEEQVFKVAYVVFIKNIKKNRIKTCTECGNVVKGQHKTCDADIDGERCHGELGITISPEAEIQIIHGDISPEAVAAAREAQEQIGRAVEAKIFPCNFNQCNSQFGKPCAYRDLKWKGDMRGLEKRERKKT
jgi:hypothetical protein